MNSSEFMVHIFQSQSFPVLLVSCSVSPEKYGIFWAGQMPDKNFLVLPLAVSCIVLYGKIH